jgi:hypothetical protein
VNTLSRLQTILAPDSTSPRRAQVIRVIVRDTVDQPRITLSVGDRLIVENRSARPLHVAPRDFFGSAFERHTLEPGESTPPLAVAGLWFQVDLHSSGRDFYPLDVYLAPNTRAV